MSDRIIIEKELDLKTDSVLSETDKNRVRDFYCSCRECLSTHENPSVQNKTFVSLKPVNLKPFYIRPYLTHEREIKFAEKEMEKFRLMGFLHKGFSEYLSLIILIKKCHDGAKLNKDQEYRTAVDFKHLNSHLPYIKFSYPEIKNMLHKIVRSQTNIYSDLDRKQTFYSINLDDDSTKYTSCFASPGSLVIQLRKLLTLLFHGTYE